MKKILITIVILVVAGLVLAWQFKDKEMKTTPPETNILNVGNGAEKKDLIRLTTPTPNQVIKSPLVIKGEARGTWYFEASFPITLVDQNGKVVVESHATADGEWMTENFVPFSTTLNFEVSPNVTKGTLILKKDNASGLPEHDDQLIIPVVFE